MQLNKEFESLPQTDFFVDVLIIVFLCFDNRDVISRSRLVSF